MKKFLRVLFSLVLVVAMSLSFTTNAMAQADGHPDVSMTVQFSNDFGWNDGKCKGKITFRIRNNSKKKVIVSKYITSFKPFIDIERTAKFDSGKNITIAPGESVYETVTFDGTQPFSRSRIYVAFKYNKKYYSYFIDTECNHYKDYKSDDHVYGNDFFEFADGSTYDYWELETKKFFKTGLHDLTTD